MPTLTESPLLPVFVPDTKVWLDVCTWKVAAGFPSPAADHTRALERIEAFERLNSENRNDWKGEIQQFPLLRMATVHQHPGDQSLAAFLLEKIFAYRVSVRLSKRHAHWGQMRLFEV